MTKAKAKKKAVKSVEKAVTKAVHKGITEDEVEGAVEHSIDKDARHEKPTTKRGLDTGKPLKKKLTINKLAADADIDGD